MHPSLPHSNVSQRVLRTARVVTVIVSLLFFTKACTATSIHLERYEALHKTFLHGAEDSKFVYQFNQLRSGPPKRFFEVAAFSPGSPFHQLAQAVFRLDILYEDNGSIVRTAECTATAISPGVLLTSFHCVPGLTTARASKLRIVRNYVSSRQTEAKITETIPKIIDGDRSSDWVLLRYPDFKHDHYIEPYIRAPIKGESTFIIGHPLGQFKVLSTGRCLVEEIRVDSFLHRCATLTGHSGSLILSVSDHAVLGVHTSNIGSFNFAYRFDNIRSSIASRTNLRLGSVVTPPSAVDTSGWALTGAEFEGAIRQVLTDKNAVALLEELIPPETGARQKVGTRRFVDMVVDGGSTEMLTAVVAREEFSPKELGELLLPAIERFNEFRVPTASMVESLLRHGAQPQPDRRGMLPQCGIEHRREIYKLLEVYGHDTKGC